MALNKFSVTWNIVFLGQMNPPIAANVAVENFSLLECVMCKDVSDGQTAFTLRKFLSSDKIFLRNVGMYLPHNGRSHSKRQWFPYSPHHIHVLFLSLSSHVRVPCVLSISDSCFHAASQASCVLYYRLHGRTLQHVSKYFISLPSMFLLPGLLKAQLVTQLQFYLLRQSSILISVATGVLLREIILVNRPIFIG
jgi:hypothetical protein